MHMSEYSIFTHFFTKYMFASLGYMSLISYPILIAYRTPFVPHFFNKQRKFAIIYNSFVKCHNCY